jgi:hypothetical protein
VPVDGLAGFIVALQAEEGVVFAPFVEADHARLFFVQALRKRFHDFRGIQGFQFVCIFHLFYYD